MGLTKNNNHRIPTEEVAKHFGYGELANFCGFYDDFDYIVKSFGTMGEVLSSLRKRRFKMVFDYDPGYEFMVTQILDEPAQESKKEIMWRYGFVGGYFEFFYNPESKNVEVWDHRNDGRAAVQVDMITDLDFPDFGEKEIQIAGTFYIRGMLYQAETEKKIAEATNS